MDPAVRSTRVSPHRARALGLAAAMVAMLLGNAEAARANDPVPCPETTIALGAQADAWIDEDGAFGNKGSDSVLTVRSAPDKNARALLRFPIPAAPAGYVQWNVRSQVEDMLASANNGFVIRDAAEGAEAGGDQTSHSREKGDEPPQ